MTAQLNRLASILAVSCLIASSLLWVKPFGIQPASASSTVQYGGFLYPWDYNNAHPMQITTPSHEGTITGGAIDFANGTNFDILAPKDGVVLYADDSSPDSWSGNCSNWDSATNYIVLGHGYQSPGVYSHYSVYYHL